MGITYVDLSCSNSFFKMDFEIGRLMFRVKLRQIFLCGKNVMLKNINVCIIYIYIKSEFFVFCARLSEREEKQ